MCRHSPCVAVRWRRVIDALRVDGDAGPPERYPSVSRAALVPPRIRHAALFRKAIHHLQPDAAHTKLAWFEGIDWSRRTALGSFGAFTTQRELTLGIGAAQRLRRVRHRCRNQ
jgi:hypothetical protein